MFLRDTVGVLIPVCTTNANLQKLTSYHPTTPDRVIQGEFQPVKYNAAYKPYGISDTTSNMLICLDRGLDATMHLLINKSQYKIDSILPYRRHVEVYLSKVVGI